MVLLSDASNDVYSSRDGVSCQAAGCYPKDKQNASTAVEVATFLVARLCTAHLTLAMAFAVFTTGVPHSIPDPPTLVLCVTVLQS